MNKSFIIHERVMSLEKKQEFDLTTTLGSRLNVYIYIYN